MWGNRGEFFLSSLLLQSKGASQGYPFEGRVSPSSPCFFSSYLAMCLPMLAKVEGNHALPCLLSINGVIALWVEEGKEGEEGNEGIKVSFNGE